MDKGQQEPNPQKDTHEKPSNTPQRPALKKPNTSLEAVTHQIHTPFQQPAPHIPALTGSGASSTATLDDLTKLRMELLGTIQENNTNLAQALSTSVTSSVTDSVTASVTSTTATHNKGMEQRIMAAITKSHAATQKQLQDHTHQIQNIKNKSDDHDMQLQRLNFELETLKKGIGAADAKDLVNDSTPITQRRPDELDPTIVRISANSYVGYDELKKVVDELAARPSVAPSAYELIGPKPQGKQFRVQFKGEGSTPTNRANKFAHTLRGKDGWERISINRPAGGTEQLFIGLDRSENEITKVRNLKTLEKIIADTASHLKPVRQNQDGCITIDWETLVNLELATKFVTPKWEECATTHNIDTAEIDRQFASKLSTFRRHL